MSQMPILNEWNQTKLGIKSSIYQKLLTTPVRDLNVAYVSNVNPQLMNLNKIGLLNFYINRNAL